MDRSLRTIAVLGPLALLGACLQVAPRSSVAFQAPADREARYAAEITLATKEDRRAEFSEAAANGRIVLPQLPEIWGPPGPDRRREQAPQAPDLAQLEPGAGSGSAGRGCASMEADPAGDTPLTDCRLSWRGEALVLPPFGDRSILPTFAPSASEPGDAPSGLDPRPPG
jgi:hypothetical protein